MKLSEIKGDKALDMFAELIEPISEIISDKDIKDALKEKSMAKAVKLAIKNHKESVITMLAILNDKDPETYECDFLSLPMQLLDIVNDPIIQQAFMSQGQKKTEKSSGSATENIEEEEN